MAKTTRNKFQIERDRQTIARLTLQGVTQRDIARRLKLSQPMVAYDLAAIRKEWQGRDDAEFAEARGFAMAKLENLEVAYWEAYDQSTKGGKRPGKPRYLAGVRACIEKRCRLLGLGDL